MADSTNLMDLPETTRNALKRSQDLRERVLAQLSETSSCTTKPRARTPLSKFTITSSDASRCEDTLRPAHRTRGEENLPTLSEREKRVLNTSLVSKRCNTFHTGNQMQTCSKDGMKVRQTLLEKKAVHRSLDDLRSPMSQEIKCEDTSSVPPGTKASRKSFTLSTSDNSRLQSVQSTAPEENARFEKPGNLSQSVPQRAQPTKEMDSSSSLEEILVSGEPSILSNCQGDTDGKNGPGGDFVVGTNAISEDEENSKLSLENEVLKRHVAEAKRKYVLFMVVSTFAFKALRKRSEQLVNMEESLNLRQVECAARVILHHLLLNSWRVAKGQISAITAENTQMQKTIENQSLQLNIIRKMQSIEKDKTSSVVQEYNEVKRNYLEAIKDNDSMKTEYAKVLEEKHALERKLRNLASENSRLSTDIQIRLDKKEMELKSMELDRSRAEKFSIENEQLANEINQAQVQIKELTAQQAHWQNQAVSYEAKYSELREVIERKEKTFEKILNEKYELSKENEILTLSKSKLKKVVEQAQVALGESNAQTKQLEQTQKACKEQLQDLEYQVEYLQSALRQYKTENAVIKQKLYDCTIKHVKRRRVWGAALYFFVNPIEAFKRLYFGSPENAQSPIAAGTGPERNEEPEFHRD